MENVSNAKNVPLNELLKGKMIVSDTSALLMAGTGILEILHDCTIVVPAVVLNELEHKRNDDNLGFLANQWIRLIENTRVNHGESLSHGVILDGYDNIKLRVEPNHSNQRSLPKHLQDRSVDNTVLAVARNLDCEKDENNQCILPRDTVVLLSNDVTMLMRATLDLKIQAHSINATQIVGATTFDGRYNVILSNADYIASNAVNYDGIESLKRLEKAILAKLPKDHASNCFIEVKLEGSDEVLHNVRLTNGRMVLVKRKNKSYNITAKTLEQDIALEYLRAPASEIPIVSLGGGAGTGKTLLTIATGLDELKAGNYQKVIVFRSLHEMGQGQEMGFLPGNVDEKMEAWAGAVFDALDVLAHKSKSVTKNKSTNAEYNQTKLQNESKKLRDMIEISPITYLRGRSLANTYMVLEEAQNFSRSEILNILSRAGVDSKIVLTFDSAQVDNRFLQAGKDADIWSVIHSLRGEDLFAHITLKQTERSKVAELASRILESS